MAPKNWLPRPSTGPFDQAGDVDELEMGGMTLLGLDDSLELFEPWIRDRYNTQVAVDGGERIVGDLSLPGRESIEEAGLSDVGQTDNPDGEHHEHSSPRCSPRDQISDLDRRAEIRHSRISIRHGLSTNRLHRR